MSEETDAQRMSEPRRNRQASRWQTPAPAKPVLVRSEETLDGLRLDCKEGIQRDPIWRNFSHRHQHKSASIHARMGNGE